MKILGNIIWLIFGGLEMAIGYLFFGLLLCITIIGIPFGWQIISLAGLALWPFGKNVRDKESASGCLPLLMNVLWIVMGGFWLAVGHTLLGLLLCITIIGIPFGMQHFKLAFLIITPFGKDVVEGN